MSMARPAVLTVADTIARSFLHAVAIRGDRPAIREKKFGVWQPTSWRQWQEIAKEIAYGLHATGFRPGDVASIIANAVPGSSYAPQLLDRASKLLASTDPAKSTALRKLLKERYPEDPLSQE